MHKPIANNLTAKAAAYYSKMTGTILVRFDRPGGRHNGTKHRHCRPITCKDGTVGVRQFNGLWRVKAYHSPTVGNDGKPMYRHADGSRYRDRVDFDASHVAWFDEIGRMTDGQAKDALQLDAYRNR